MTNGDLLKEYVEHGWDIVCAKCKRKKERREHVLAELIGEGWQILMSEKNIRLECGICRSECLYEPYGWKLAERIVKREVTSDVCIIRG